MSLARARNSGILSLLPISRNILIQASFAPPCIGPHRLAMPAATQANGLASDEAAMRTVEVDAFCSWSAWRRKSTSIVLQYTSGGRYSGSNGCMNIILKKLHE